MSRTTLCFWAYVALAVALAPAQRGIYTTGQLLAVVGALTLAIIGVTWRREPTGGRGQFAPVALGLMAVAELLALFLAPASAADGTMRLPLIGRVSLGAILILICSYAWPGMPGERWRFAAIAALFFVAAASLVRVWGHPRNDVWQFQQEACRHLLRGENPYASEYPNPYPHADYYGPGILKDNKIQSCPYPPLSLLLVLPGYLLGDVRWVLLAATVMAAGFTVAAGRQSGLPAGHPAELAAVALLVHPKAWVVLETAWTEPLVLLAIAASAWALAGGRQRAAGLTLAATVFVKQYGLLALAPAWASRRWHWRRVMPWVAVGAAITLPFILWDPRAAWRGLVEFQLVSPFRADSLSIPAAAYLATGRQMAAAWGFAAAGLVTGLMCWRRTPGVSAALLGTAAICLAFFAFNKSVHLNYYWLVLGLLAATTLCAAAEDRLA